MTRHRLGRNPKPHLPAVGEAVAVGGVAWTGASVGEVVGSADGDRVVVVVGKGAVRIDGRAVG